MDEDKVDWRRDIAWLLIGLAVITVLYFVLHPGFVTLLVGGGFVLVGVLLLNWEKLATLSRTGLHRIRAGILAGYCVLVLGIVTIVPWSIELETQRLDRGYSFILDPPVEPWLLTRARIDYPLIALEFVGVSAAAGLLFGLTFLLPVPSHAGDSAESKKGKQP